MPMPNHRETEKMKDKKAADSISQSALVNISTPTLEEFLNLYIGSVGSLADSIK
jgi:hypothetical protein